MLLPEPSVSAHPGDELDSVKLRSVSGFNSSANAGAADAASGVPAATAGREETGVERPPDANGKA